MSHQLNPFFVSVFQHPDPRYSTSVRETGLLRLIPLAWQLASPQPNTPQVQQAPLTVPPGAWGLDLPQFSLSLRRLPSTSQGAPGEVRQAASRQANPSREVPAPTPTPSTCPLPPGLASRPPFPLAFHLTSDSSRPGTVGRPMSGRQWPLTPPLGLGTVQRRAMPVNEVSRSDQVARAMAAGASG